MRRGEIWSMRDSHYASKARPVVIVQSDEHDEFDSIILCLFTTYESSDIKTRVLVNRSSENGLMMDSYVMTEKIVTVNKNMLGERIGKLSETDMNNVSDQLRAILGL